MAKVWDITADPEGAIEAAVTAVNAGSCIVLPTDTVYGIGADAFSAHAVQGLLDAKERGRDMPPPVLIADASALRSLTLVVTAQANLRMDLGDRGQTIAVRVPDHDFTRDLLRATGPLAVSSANVSGQPTATTIVEAQDQLGRRVSVYLDGGPATAAVPSTIVDLTGVPRILREGKLSRAELAAVVPVLGGEDAIEDAIED